MSENKSLRCEKCNTLNEKDARFCEMCGHPLSIHTGPSTSNGNGLYPAYPPDLPQNQFQGYSAVQPPSTSGINQPKSKSWLIWVLGCAGVLVIFCLLAGGALLLLKPEINLPSFLNPEMIASEVAEGNAPLLANTQEPGQLEVTSQTEEPGQVDVQVSATEENQGILPQAEQNQVAQPAAPETSIATDRETFYCVPSDGPTTLTITAAVGSSTTDVIIFWRLNDKVNGTTTEWEQVYMQANSSGGFSYKFDANTWDGTNNFYYPPLMHESWFEYQIMAQDGSFLSDVFSDITFFPCAQ